MKSHLKKLLNKVRNRNEYLFYLELNDFCRYFTTKSDMIGFVSDYAKTNVIYSVQMYKFIVQPL